jgi:hypothetical protein
VRSNHHLESAQGRRTLQRCNAINRGLQREVVSQFVMVVEIFIAECQAVQALTQLRQCAVAAALNPRRRSAARNSTPPLLLTAPPEKSTSTERVRQAGKSKLPGYNLSPQNPSLDFALTQRDLAIIRGLAVPCTAHAMNDPG